MEWLEYYWHKKMRRPYTLVKRIDVGRGQPVIFLHGLASNGEVWQKVVGKFDDTKYRTVALDLLGFGVSPQPDWLEYSVEDHAKAVIATLRRNRIRKPVVLVGHSMGSMVAAYIAQKYPKMVKHLILYQMPVYRLPPSLDIRDYRRQAYMSTFHFLTEHPRMTLWYAKVLGGTASKVAGFVLDESNWQPFELSLKNTVMQQQAFEQIHTLTMPVDIIEGKYDMLVLRKYVRKLFRKKPDNVRFHEIKEAHRVTARTAEVVYALIEHHETGVPHA